ncbi:MAG: methyltransferase domain-containing protein [Aeromicrobium erythreum]
MSTSGVVRTTPPSPAGRSGAERAATWLVDGTLSCVLHVGDSPLAYVLADQGHEVVVAGDDVVRRRHPEVLYARTSPDRLPFRADAFDVVVAPDLHESTTTLADYARVLRPGGLLSTLDRSYDDTIPWVRKLREIVGDRTARRSPAPDTLGASGLFEEPETSSVGSWEQLDLPGLLRFADEIRDPRAGDDEMRAVRSLFEASATGTGTLRLRHETRCTRARVVKEAADPMHAPDTLLLDFR